MMAELGRCVKRLQHNDSTAYVVLTSPGAEVFCAGGDLRQVSQVLQNAEDAYRMSVAMQSVLHTLTSLPMVSVADISGPAIGGGAELAVACDLRVAGPASSLRFVQARLGIAPGWGGSRYLGRHVGEGRALAVLTGDGTISPTHDPTDLFCRTALGDMATLADVVGRETAPTASVRAVKTQIVAARGSADEAIEQDARAFAGRWRSPEHVVALTRWSRR
jgi:enoyl-CoA hydratase/carnithine racemase